MKTETIFGLFSNEQIGFAVASAKVAAGDLRLDSSHFVDDSQIVLKDDMEFTTLSHFIDSVEEPTLFTRIYCDKKYGVPYISSSEMSEIEPPITSRYISKTLTKNIRQYIIKRGQILVSAAGTVGSIVVATKDLNGVAGTSDILRINVNTEKNLGFVYTYLTSSFGANELANLAYGAIIKRVRGFQLAELKTPVIENKYIAKMNKLVASALENRDEASRLLKQARSLVLKYNHLPSLSLEEVERKNPDKDVEYRFASTNEFTHDYRLDAHFYSDIYKNANSAIKNNSKNIRPLSELTSAVFMGYRFNRNFVDNENGVPYIGTRNTLQIRPTELKYLSKSETSKLNELILKRGWILLSRSGSLGGTFGKVSLVWKNFEGYAGSDHIIRICAKEDEIDPAYLYCFLSSIYGYLVITQLRHGALIDEIDPEDLGNVLIPLPSDKQQKEIGDLVRQAYDLRAEAIRLEDEAQALLTHALTND